MTVAQLPLVVAPHNNRQLFSDYYLNEILPTRVEWQALLSDAGAVRRSIANLFEQFSPSTIEAQTEDELVKPILRLLGHTFEVQPALRTSDGTKRPDYILYHGEQGVRANKGIVLTEESVRSTAFAVADAKYWNRPLDTAQAQPKGDAFSNRNPSFQISYYIQQSGLPWGVLTNGRLWRLYHGESAHKLDRFYEVDLEELVLSGDLHRFLYFFAFFRREAFDPGRIGLQEILRESVDYALKVGDQIKQQVFDALRHLAQGFLDYPANKLVADHKTLDDIYQNSLILLYRLLFVFYAEARELLPIRANSIYRDSYSLRSLAREVVDAERQGRRLLATTGNRWPRLQTLFQAIDKGSPPLTVATFNGGLFDAEKHPFLERYVVGDHHLEKAIDTLARVNNQFVDYRDLAEMHLGTIYEGLLEYHIETIEPEDGWQLDLVNEQGERKRSGSYYTPNYIVKYIVDHTIGPILAAAIEGKADDEKVDAILQVNVLDPAMGSGYFLVEVTEYIARFIVNLNLTRPDEEAEESDLAYWKRRVVQSCVYGVDINSLAVELAKLSLWLITVAEDRPLSFLDHHLRTGNSLIGSQITDRSEPRHQSRSAKSKQKKAAQAVQAGQQTLVYDDAFQQSVSSAVDSMWLVEHSESANVADVKAQERLYDELHEALVGRYGRFADLVAAADFGLEHDFAHWQVLSDFALGRAPIVPPSFHRLMDEVEALAKNQNFFHWDLEFPEVFFTRTGRPLADRAGFDAIVGNPPYVRQERFTGSKPYLRSRYRTFNSVADLYIYFFERGMELLKDGGRLGFISSGTFARSNSAKVFRSYLPTMAQLDQVIDFGENQPFRGAEMVRPTIAVLRKQTGKSPYQSLLIQGKIPSSLDHAMETYGIEGDQLSLKRPEWTFQAAATSRVADRIAAMGRPLNDIVDGRIFYGVKTGYNEAFIINEAKKLTLISQDAASADLIKPLLAGQDLRPWYHEYPDRFLVFTRQGTDIEKYPAIKEYLEEFRTRLEPQPRTWNTTEKWEGRKPGDYRWFELQDTIDYYREFEKHKIVWPDIAKLPRFSWD